MIKIKGPKLSKKAIKAIKRIMKWEDDSWRNVMKSEPPYLKKK